MKDFLISITLFVIVIVCVAINSIYVSSISSKLESIAERLDLNSSPAPLIAELEAIWEKNRPWLSLSVDTPQLDSVDIIIDSIRLSYEMEDAFEFEKYRLQLSELSKEISILEKLTLQTVL